MHPLTQLLVIVATLSWSGAILTAQDLDKLSRSEVWQVRYCVALEFKAPSAQARTSLERLAKDTDVRVARQAFAVYSRVFVDLDNDTVRRAFERGDFDLVGSVVSDPKVFRTPEFWLNELAQPTDDSTKARAVRAIGLCGDATILSKLSGLAGSTNPYLLAELAAASRRLGNDERYLAALEAVLTLPLKDNIYYQTFAVDCLLQTHPARAKSAWDQINKGLASLPDFQPNWVYAHVLQRERLP